MAIPAGRSDEALLAAHVAGDPEAFDELVRRYSERLWGFAVRTVGNSHDASDVLQDALLSAFRSAARWRGDATVSTWLHRIVLNACLDRIRRRRVRRADPLDEVDVPLPRDPVADRMTVLAVGDALAELPLPQRAAVVLVDMEGMTIAEAAAVLGIPEGTVKSRAARGRYRLAELLGHLRPGAAEPPDAEAPPPDAARPSRRDRADRTGSGNPGGPGRVRAPGADVRSGGGGPT